MRRIIYGILILLIFVLLARWFAGSLFLNAPTRLQIVVYGQDTRIYSIDTEGNTHYIIHFASDEKIGVPGGYSYYRVGGLGKLVHLEKKPQILGRAFSLASSSFVSYYFNPPTDSVYYGGQVKDEVIMPNATELFRYESNANVFDRLYLFLHFLQVKKSDYLLLRGRGDAQDKNGARMFLPETFSKETEGFIFNAAYRRERQTVQILYTKYYNAARTVGNILEGNGIRVVDIKKAEKSNSKCSIAGGEKTETARAMKDFFHCALKPAKNEVSDILFDIRGIEKDWEIE
ncbi:hypothetical protein HYS00_00090 [Candidatus Microgenomates bacterium]|nr:hypothetical protein [Candidatus Microgenomates bacterium]